MMKVRHGIGILALAFAVGTAGACSGNRAEPDWRPRTSRGSVYGPTKTKPKVRREDRTRRRSDDGVRRGQGKKKDDNGNRGRGNGSNNRSNGNGKKKGHG